MKLLLGVLYGLLFILCAVLHFGALEMFHPKYMLKKNLYIIQKTFYYNEANSEFCFYFPSIFTL